MADTLDGGGVQSTGATWRVGVDIGGTFTDFVILAPDSRMQRLKILSTPDNYARAITEGLRNVLSDDARRGIDTLVHGTTVATNAILQGTRQNIALVTTRGFRDTLELRRGRRPDSYALNWTPPPPLVERALRLEVNERLDAVGQVVVPLEDADVDRCIQVAQDNGIAAIAICLINAYANPVHERRIAERIAAALPHVKVTCSSLIAPEPGEFERTSTTVVNALLLPVVHEYLHGLEGALREIGVTPQPQVMQSDGTTAGVPLVCERPYLIIESGPAAGMVAAASLVEELGRPSVITFDMGGTTAKAGLIKDHRVALNDEQEVGHSINRGAGFSKGAGYVVRGACVDLTEVGSGGGSVAWVDNGGALRVGPQSTGASPGPACYGLGGHEPTVTDANVVLGYVNPEAIAGGRKRIHRDLAHEAMLKLAHRLGVSELEAAWAVFCVANATMRRAIRAVSVERGYDPRRFTLVAFGGAGGVHAAALAADLEMPEVVVPIVPGLFSSLGLMFSDIASTRIATRRVELSTAATPDLDHAVAALAREAAAELRRHHRLGAEPEVEAFASLQYRGQSTTLTLPMPDSGSAQERAHELARRFHEAHQRTRGHSAESEPIEVTTLRVRVFARAPKMRFCDLASSVIAMPDGTSTGQRRPRDLYFGPALGVHQTPVIARRDLHESPTTGPLVVEEAESTIIVPPRCSARIDHTGSILIDTGHGRSATTNGPLEET